MLSRRLAVAAIAGSMLAAPFTATQSVAAFQSTGNAGPSSAPDIPGYPPPSTSASVGDIADRPSDFRGASVVVEGRINLILGPRSFTVVDAGGSGAEIPVIGNGMLLDRNGQPVDPSMHENEPVTIVGTVRRFELQEFEEALAVDLDDRRWQVWEGFPTLIASEVTPVRDAATTSPPSSAAEIPGNTIPTTTTRLDRIANDPSGFFGREVRVQGIVDQILGPRSFTLLDPRGGAAVELPVVSNGMLVGPGGNPVDATRFEGQFVSIVGTVHPFDIQTIERAVAADLDEQAWREWERQPVIVASDVTIVQGGTGQQPALPGQSQGGQARRSQQGAGRQESASATRSATVADVARQPARYYDQSVTIQGPVDEMLGPRAFVVADDNLLMNEEVLVIAARPMIGQHDITERQSLRADDVVRVTGTVHPFDHAQIEREYNLALEESRFAAWDGKSVVIATSIRTTLVR